MNHAHHDHHDVTACWFLYYKIPVSRESIVDTEPFCNTTNCRPFRRSSAPSALGEDTRYAPLVRPPGTAASPVNLESGMLSMSSLRALDIHPSEDFPFALIPHGGRPPRGPTRPVRVSISNTYLVPRSHIPRTGSQYRTSGSISRLHSLS